MSRRRVFHGWWSVLALSVTETVSYGILYYAFTVFVTPLARELGASIASVAGAYAVGVVVSGLLAGRVGQWLDRHGARGLMTAGSVLAGALLMAWSMIDSLLGLYLVWTLMGFALATVLYEPAFAVLAVWFDRRRPAALTVLTFIAGFASVIFLPLAGWWVETLGWREALRALAWVLWLVTVPLHALVLRRHPRDVGQEVDGGPAETHARGARCIPGRRGRRSPHPSPASVAPAEAFRSPAFGWLTVSFTASMMVIMALGVHLVPVLEERGLSAAEGAAVGGAVGLLALPGRLVFTPLGAVVSRHLVTAAIFLAQAAGLVALWAWPGPVGLGAFVLLYGIGFGAITPARAALVVETFGPTWYGTIAGRLALIGTLARAAAPVALGWLAGRGAGYDGALVTLIALALVAAVTVVLAGRPGALATPR
jgi:MFS family permease